MPYPMEPQDAEHQIGNTYTGPEIEGELIETAASVSIMFHDELAAIGLLDETDTVIAVAVVNVQTGELKALKGNFSLHKRALWMAVTALDRANRTLSIDQES